MDLKASLPLTSRTAKLERTVIDVKGVRIGGPEPVFMAGPCSIESLSQMREVAHAVKGHAHILRAVPLSPHFTLQLQGLAEEG